MNQIVISSVIIQQFEQECYELIQTLTDKQIFTYMGVFNTFAWRAAVDYEVLNRSPKKEGEPKEYIRYENLHRIMGDDVSLTYTLVSLEKYMKKHWSIAYYTRKTLRKMRSLLVDHGFFWFDRENQRKGARWGAENGVEGQGTATPPELEKANIPKMVICYNMMYSYLKNKLGKETLFELMPKHGGMLMIDLYESMFNDTKSFSGNVITDNPQIVVVAPDEPENFVKKQITWLWRNIKDLPKEVWRSLVRRDKQIPEPVKYQSVPWDGVEVIDRADFYVEERELAIA